MYANKVMLSSSSCNKRLKEVFLNSGKTLKECISQLKLEGFSSNNIVKAIVTILADVTWEE